ERPFDSVRSRKTSRHFQNENLPFALPCVPVRYEVSNRRVDAFSRITLKTPILHVLYRVRQPHRLLLGAVLLFHSEHDDAATLIGERRDGLQEPSDTFGLLLVGKLPLVLKVSVFMPLLSDELFHVPDGQVTKVLTENRRHFVLVLRESLEIPPFGS